VITTTDTTAARILRPLREMDPLLLLVRASLIALLVNSNDDAVVMIPMALICLVALPRAKVVLSPWFWAGLFVAVGARQLATWSTVDDHIIVTTYWCGALALGLGARNPRATLGASARLLIGTLFAFAAGWKLSSGEFADGTFWRHAFLFDDRFAVIAHHVGGTADAIRRADHAAVDSLLQGSGTGSVLLREGPRNVALANAFTWWGLVIETAIAATFLLPLRERWGWLRHACLFAFACTTYVIVPVGGFGTLLLVLGAAQASTERLRLAYYLGGIVLLVWSGLWPQLFL
jgi:hypothetical protein